MLEVIGVNKILIPISTSGITYKLLNKFHSFRTRSRKFLFFSFTALSLSQTLDSLRLKIINPENF